MKAFEVFTIGVFAASALARLQIILPNSHTEWEAGKPGTIKWKAIDGGVTGRLSIELMEGSDPANMQAVTTIAENIPATGMETHWNVPKSFKNSNNYSIKIVDENGEEYYGQYFKGAGGKTDMGKKAGKQQQGRSAKGDDKAKSSEAAASNKQQQQQQQQGIDSTSPTSSTLLLNDQQAEATAKTYYQQAAAPAPTSARPTYQASQDAKAHALDQVQGGVSEFLSQVDFSSAHLNQIANPSGIEYLNLEDGPIYTDGVMPSRGWSDDLCYGTGTMYLLGLGTGGAWGFLEGMRSQHGANFKLRLNSVLNSMTRRGPFVGNSLGVLGMFYNSLNSAIGAYRGTRDQYNSLGAAAISGMLFKIGGGPRASLISGIICTGVVGAYHASVSAYKSAQQKKISGASLSSPSEPQLSSTSASAM
ncbi:Mitochondrial import inner membrane translocase subunit tim23 [Coemansia sp. Benny D115]|nr:Mitochondrial import inner membrane translocase subunit tim23 [Coemansia sp. Benny D115]